jgi:hypothetical protein
VLGGVIAQAFGFPAAFMLLGALSVGSLIIWIRFAPILRRGADAADSAQALYETG